MFFYQSSPYIIANSVWIVMDCHIKRRFNFSKAFNKCFWFNTLQDTGCFLRLVKGTVNIRTQLKNESVDRAGKRYLVPKSWERTIVFMRRNMRACNIGGGWRLQIYISFWHCITVQMYEIVLEISNCWHLYFLKTAVLSKLSTLN